MKNIFIKERSLKVSIKSQKIVSATYKKYLTFKNGKYLPQSCPVISNVLKSKIYQKKLLYVSSSNLLAAQNFEKIYRIHKRCNYWQHTVCIFLHIYLPTFICINKISYYF